MNTGRSLSFTWIWYGISLLLFLFEACNPTESSASHTVPDDTARVALPTSQGVENGFQGFSYLGYHKGEKAPDLTLFSLNGTPFTLGQAHHGHKPVLLVSGSYTCDASRHNLPAVEHLVRQYKDKLDVYMVYVIDAHPQDTISPYSVNHRKWIVKANLAEHVAASQPRTYGQRKALALRWKQQYHISAPVLVDRPDNTFWMNFGQAPNMVYLLEPDGTVSFQEAWYKEQDVEQAVSDLFHSH